MNRREHLLIILSEECAEVQQAVAKILRFGPDSDYDGITNRKKLQNEFNDVLALADMLKQEDIIIKRDDARIYNKQEKVNRFLKDSKQIGTLNDWINIIYIS